MKVTNEKGKKEEEKSKITVEMKCSKSETVNIEMEQRESHR